MFLSYFWKSNRRFNNAYLVLFIAAGLVWAFGARSANVQVEARQIEIHSSWSGWGSARTDVVIRREPDGRYLRGTDVIPKRLVSDLVAAMHEPVIRAPELGNLGITPDWLRANAGSALRDASEPQPPGRAETAQFMRVFQDVTRMRKIVAQIFCNWHTDDHPSVNVAVTFENGSELTVSSNAQNVFMLPWSQDAGHATYNSDLSRAIAALLPAKATNRERLTGEGLAGQLAMELLREMSNMQPRFSCAI